MTAEDLAQTWFECHEEERMAVNLGAGAIKNPGLEWVIWRWQDVSLEGRAFQTAVARRVQERLGKIDAPTS